MSENYYDDTKDYYAEEIESLIEESEIVEEGVVYKSNDMTIVLTNQEGRNYGDKGEGLYFKVYNASNQKKATKMCRIDMSKPKYVIHNNSGIDGGKEEWKLNSKDKKKIVEILNNKKSNIGDQKGKDMWDAIVDEAKDKLNSKENVDFETIRNNMPNYSNL